jgi:hypothetical protein
MHIHCGYAGVFSAAPPRGFGQALGFSRENSRQARRIAQSEILARAIAHVTHHRGAQRRAVGRCDGLFVSSLLRLLGQALGCGARGGLPIEIFAHDATSPNRELADIDLGRFIAGAPLGNWCRHRALRMQQRFVFGLERRDLVGDDARCMGAGRRPACAAIR